MKFKNRTIGILIVVLVAVVSYVLFVPTQSKPKTIAVFLTQSHPALERVRAGFISGIEKDPSLELKIHDYNAEGNVQQANLIAQQIAQDKNNYGVFAIGTLAAQTVAKIEKERPIVFAAVSDPGVITQDKQALNISGLTDAIDAKFQIETILNLIPGIKTISLLYSPQEANATSQVKKLQKAAEEKGMKVELVGVYEPQQINSASLVACEKGDAVLIPLDNQLASAMPLVMRATKSLKCPVIISDEALIHHGATMAFGLDYRKSGEEAASMMIDIITNKATPELMGFINPKAPSVYINRRVVREKGIMLNPESTVEVTNVQGE